MMLLYLSFVINTLKKFLKDITGHADKYDEG